MNSISNTATGLELAQIGWVVPDVHAAVRFPGSALGIAGLLQPEYICGQDRDMTYPGEVVACELLTTQAFNVAPSSNTSSRFPAKACSMTASPGILQAHAAHVLLFASQQPGKSFNFIMIGKTTI